MKFFNRPWNSSYDELITFYPRFYQDVLEMQAILRADGCLIDGAINGIEQIYLNAFIDYAGKEQIARWEDFLHISLNRSLALDERRRAVKAYIIGFGKMSASVIKAIVNTYLDITDTEVDFRPMDEEGNNAVLIYIPEDDDISGRFQPLRDLLRKRIPAHLWYWYIQRIHYLMDNRETMAFVLPRIRFKTGMDFWDTRRHNGSFLHNGEALHGMKRRYGMRLMLSVMAGAMATDEGIGFPAARSHTGISTGAAMAAMARYALGMDFWGATYHNGAAFHNGRHVRGSGRGRMAASVRFRSAVKGTEGVGEASVLTRTKEAYFHNGEYAHSGRARHKTIYKKEVIQ